MKKSILVLSLLALLGSSCKRKEICVGGLGGDLTLVLFPQHHGKAIYSQDTVRDTAFVKFNTQDAPAVGVPYDLIVYGVAGENHVNVHNLKCGDYYVYMTGYDSSIQQRVKGAIPVSTSQKTGELDVVVPVSE